MILYNPHETDVFDWVKLVENQPREQVKRRFQALHYDRKEGCCYEINHTRYEAQLYYQCNHYGYFGISSCDMAGYSR